jgi:hypothetical protein
MEKTLNQKNFHYFFWTPLGSRVSIFPLFATSVVYTGGKLVGGVVDTGGNLPLALWHRWQICHRPLAKPVAKFAAGVVDIGDKFCAGVVDTSGNFATSLILVTLTC